MRSKKTNVRIKYEKNKAFDYSGFYQSTNCHSESISFNSNNDYFADAKFSQRYINCLIFFKHTHTVVQDINRLFLVKFAAAAD